MEGWKHAEHGHNAGKGVAAFRALLKREQFSNYRRGKVEKCRPTDIKNVEPERRKGSPNYNTYICTNLARRGEIMFNDGD